MGTRIRTGIIGIPGTLIITAITVIERRSANRRIDWHPTPVPKGEAPALPGLLLFGEAGYPKKPQMRNLRRRFPRRAAIASRGASVGQNATGGPPRTRPTRVDVYRPRFLGHRIEAYAALATG
jgi:hypothetical protein